MGLDTPFRSGSQVRDWISPDSAGWPSGLSFVIVKPSKKPRKSKIEATGVTIYDFDGCDVYAARALVIGGIIRWQVTHRYALSPARALLWTRHLFEYHLKIRPRLDHPEKAEEEVADILRADAALNVLKENAR